MNYVPHIVFNKASEIRKARLDEIGGIDLLNYELQRLGIKSKLNTKKGRKLTKILDFPEDIHKTNIMQVIDEINEKYNNDYGKCEDQD